jgi:von Willebrand factor type A domain/Putative glutamine amidotransferase
VAGDNQVGFSVPASTQGVERFQVRVETASDSVTQNNVGYGAVEVTGPPKVLLLEGRSGAGAGVVGALRASGMGVDVMASSSLPPLDELTTYKSILLADVNLDSLTADQVATLSSAVRDAGRGMVTLGGTQSYGLGGYLGSDFEQLLPVVSDILDPKRRQTVSEVLAIDTSGSMAACHCAEGANGMPSAGNRVGGGVNKTDIARAGAARAIEALSASDSVGILAVDTNEEWVLDLQQLPADEVVTSGLRDLQPTGTGTDLSRALTTAASQLRESHTSLKHIILFTDGFVNETGIFDDLADQAASLREEGITTSVLATGEGASQDLEKIAVAGGGRFYPGRDLQEIPQLMQEEATIASRDFITEGSFVPVVTSSAAAVRDLTATPPLLGYVATTAKPQASTHLRIGPDQDPLLASWNVGLGRVSSWTSDGGERWSQTWTDWDGYVDFWSRVVGDTFPREASSQAVTAHVVDGVLQVRLEGTDDFADGSEATARVIGPDGTASDVRLERVGSKAFAGEVPVTAAGSYAVAASVSSSRDNADASTSSALASLSYSPEYSPGAADPPLLRRVSELTGGRGEIKAEDAFDPTGLSSGRSRVPLARWFLLLAALLWPLAVALSRLVLRGRVTTQLAYASATATWWLRTHAPSLPSLPGRSEKAPRSPTVPSTPSPIDPTPPIPRPTKPARPPEPNEEKAETQAPVATLGSLLASQRRRRTTTDDPDDPTP